MFSDYTMNLTEQEYHDYPAWSHSLIANYARNGFSAMSTLHDKKEPTPEMKFGSLVDCMLTRGMKEAEERYLVSDEPLPTPAVKNILDYVLNKYNRSYTDISTEEWDEAFNWANYYPKWNFTTKMAKMDEGMKYYEQARSGKEIVSNEDWNDALAIVKAVRLDPFLKNLFGTKNTDTVKYVYQSQFVTTMTLPSTKQVKVKIMPDLLVINTKEKTIRPLDFKTCSMPAYDFANQFVKMRYDIEAITYTDVLKNVLKDTEYAEYTILPYLFTAMNRTDKVPVTYEYDPVSQPDGFSFKNYQYKYWTTLLDEMVQYEEDNAIVPSYIKTDAPNDLLALLNRE